MLESVEVSILLEALWCQALDAIVSHIQQAEELLSIVHRKPAALRLWQFLIWLGESTLTAFRPDVVVLDKVALANEPLWQDEPIITLGTSVKLVVEVTARCSKIAIF